MKKSLTISALLICITRVFGQLSTPTIQIINYPEILKTSESEIGSTLVSKEKKEIHSGFHLNTTIEKKAWDGYYKVSPTDMYLYKTDDKWEYYVCLDDCMFFQDGLVKSFQRASKGGIKRSLDGKEYKLFENYKNEKDIPVDGYFFHETKLKEKPNLTPIKVTLKKDLTLKKEFIYNGKIGNSVKFIYREFIDDLARPSFTQEIQYDLNESPFVGFKGLKIEILSATNTLIKYKVIKHFLD